MYVAGYSAFRIFEESLRIDSSEHFLGLRLNFYIACGLMLFGFAWFARTQRTARRPGKGAALLAIGAILCVATAGCGHAAHPGQPTAMAADRQAHLVAGLSHCPEGHSRHTGPAAGLRLGLCCRWLPGRAPRAVDADDRPAIVGPRILLNEYHRRYLADCRAAASCGTTARGLCPDP